jgi:hypothetical protein
MLPLCDRGIPSALVATGVDSCFTAGPSALSREIVSRLGTGVVDAYLKHGKTALQFGRAAFCTFPGAELGLKSAVDFEGKTGFRQFGRSAGHSESIVVGSSLRIGYGESGSAGKPVPMIVEGVAP